MKNRRYFRLLMALILICSMALGFAPAAFAEEETPAATAEPAGQTAPEAQAEPVPDEEGTGPMVMAAEKTYWVSYKMNGGSGEEVLITGLKPGDKIPAYDYGTYGVPVHPNGKVFLGWQLRNGNVGSGGTIKNTNLIYWAVWGDAPAFDAAKECATRIQYLDAWRIGGSESWCHRSESLLEGCYTVSEPVFDPNTGKLSLTVTLTNMEKYAAEKSRLEGGAYSYVYDTVAAGYTGDPSLTFTYDSSRNSWVASQAKLTIYFTRQYNVTFKDGAEGAVFNDTIIPAPEDQRYTYTPSMEAAATIPAFDVPERPGYTFTGWEAESGTLTEDGKAVTSDAVLSAQWEANEYTLSFDAAGGSAAEAVTVTYGEPIGALPETVREGYRFEGWFYADGTQAGAEDLFAATEDITLTARWTEETYTLTFNPGDGTAKPESVTVAYGKPIGDLAEATRKGYRFDGWFYADGTQARSTDVYNVLGDSELTAKWTANTYTIRFDPNGGKVDVTEKKVTFGEKLGELPVPTKEGCKFAGWCDNNGNLYLENTVYGREGDVAVFACWIDPSVNPKTGDEANVWLYAALMLGSLGAAAYVTMQLKKRKEN